MFEHLLAEEILSIHDYQVEEFGGLAGIKAGKTVEALTGRIDQSFYYDPPETITEAASAYLEVIAKAHAYKRTATGILSTQWL